MEIRFCEADNFPLGIYSLFCFALSVLRIELNLCRLQMSADDLNLHKRSPF